MTNSRSRAYRRVIAALDDIGDATLWPVEQGRIRDAADALLFSGGFQPDEEAANAFAEVTLLSDNLIEAERWTGERAARLLDDLWACGPESVLDQLAA